jgi:choline monooxygenase
VLLGIQADHAFAMIVEPQASDLSMEHLRLYYVGEEAVGDQHAASRNATLESWRVVFAEDIDAVEGMQSGRRSPGYGGGVFSPVMDNPTHHFHQWMARKLKAA